MARLPYSDMDTVLERVVVRLVAQLTEATTDNCFVSYNPDAIREFPVSGRWAFIVSPSPSGSYDPESFTGGGNYMAEINTVFVVTAHSHVQLDPPGKADYMLNDSTFGLFPMKRKIVKALAEHDLQDSNGDEVLNEPIYPADYTWEMVDRSRANIQVGFSIRFDEDLTT